MSGARHEAPTDPASGGAAGAALVTGAARRLGRAIALELAAGGWNIVLHYRRSADEARATAREIESIGRRAALVRADLDDERSTLALFDQAREALPGLRLLVNNASRFEPDRPEDFDTDSMLRHMRSNLAAPLLLARRLHQSLATGAPESARGAVVNLLDQKLENLNPDFYSYTLSKAALLAATRMMAMAFAPVLRVNAVSPGATLRSWEQSEEGFTQASHIALLDRSSEPVDIARAVRYLAEARAVTGVNLVVDGGQHLMPLDRDVMFLTQRL